MEIVFFWNASIDELLRDTDSEMDDEDDSKKSRVKKGKKKHGKDAWLMETGDDEIVDFMDPTASKQVLGETSVAQLFCLSYCLFK